jgi:undecaprenyl-diphosphatase
MDARSAANEAVAGELSVPSPWKFLPIAAACIFLAILCLIAFRHLFPHPSAWPQGWFNSFDAGIVTYVNRFANHPLWLGPAVVFLDKHNILKGGPIVLLLWVAFFQRTGSANEILDRRRIIVATVPLAIFGVCLARVLAVVLPFRARPVRTAALHFQIPHGAIPSVLWGWSSFPSDHAVLFVTLAVGLLIASRLLGSIALVYTCVFILLPRVFSGFHWPTDLLAGGAIGVALASMVTIAAFRDFIWRMTNKCWQISPGIFAAFIFLLSYEIIDLFGTPLTLAKDLLQHHLAP